MPKKGEAVAKLGLDYSQFEQAAKAVRGLTGIMAGAISSAIGNLTATAFTKAAGAIARFAGSIKSSLREVYQMGERLDNLSKQTLVATKDYLTFALALEKGLSSSDAAKVLGANAEIMGRNASLFRDISIKFYAAGERLKGFWIGVAERIAPVLNPLLDRLLKLDLSQWGQAFAAPIADAVAIIVQLADDGELWTTLGLALQAALLTGVDVLQYLGKIGAEVFQALVAGGFDAGVVHAIDTWKAFTGWLGTAFESVAADIGDAFYTAFTDVLSLVYEIFDMAGEISKMLGLEDDATVDARIAGRAEDIQNRRRAVGQGPAFPTLNYEAGAPIGEAIKKIMEEVGPFTLSGKAGAANSEFNSKLKEALEKFLNRPEVKKPEVFNNQTPLSEKAFGVDSLSAAGGGGGLGNLAVSVAEKQLDKLNEMVSLMRGRDDAAKSYENFYRRNVSNPTNFNGSFDNPLRTPQLRRVTL